MPVGMFLKSTVAASSIDAPEPGKRIEDFFARVAGSPTGASGEDPHPEPPTLEHGEKTPLESFVRYGLWFTDSLPIAVEPAFVQAIDAAGDGFRVTLASGEALAAGAVVVATGHGSFATIPAELAQLAPGGPSADGPVSHSSQHTDLGRFAGARLAIVGAGQSALEQAALAHEAGAEVTVIARSPEVRFNRPPEAEPKRRLRSRLTPSSSLGRGVTLTAVGRIPGPGAFRHLPERTRLQLVRSILGPAGAWWLRPRIEGQVLIHTDSRIIGARAIDRGVHLELGNPDGTTVLDVDHVIAATGYRPDVDALGILAPELRQAIRRTAAAPRLSAGFESSVPGLFFTGLAAAPTFGPAMRFVCGTEFAGPRVAASVARRAGTYRAAVEPDRT